MAENAKFANIDAYFATLTPESKQALEAIRQLIHRKVPEAQEAISYQMPALNPDFPLGALTVLLGAQRSAFGHFAPSFVVNSQAIDSSRVAKLTQNPPRWPLES